MSSEYYVYTLANSLTGKVFYVGKGKGSRINAHERNARKGLYSSTGSIIRQIWKQGGEIVKTRVYETSVEQDAYLYEWALINLIHGKETLVNWHEGGQALCPKLHKQITIVLSCEVLHAVDAVTPDSRQKYIERVLRLALTPELVAEVQSRKIAFVPQAKYPCSTDIHLPLDIIDLLQSLPRGMGVRSHLIEYLLRRDAEIAQAMERPS